MLEFSGTYFLRLKIYFSSYRRRKSREVLKFSTKASSQNQVKGGRIGVISLDKSWESFICLGVMIMKLWMILQG